MNRSKQSSLCAYSDSQKWWMSSYTVGSGYLYPQRTPEDPRIVASEGLHRRNLYLLACPSMTPRESGSVLSRCAEVANPDIIRTPHLSVVHNATFIRMCRGLFPYKFSSGTPFNSNKPASLGVMRRSRMDIEFCLWSEVEIGRTIQYTPLARLMINL